MRERSRPAPGQRPVTRCRPRDPALLTAAARYYAGQLRHSPEAQAYLASRGISLDTAMRLGLGHAPGRGLRTALASAGFAAGRIRESGLFAERGERFAGWWSSPRRPADVSAGCGAGHRPGALAPFPGAARPQTRARHGPARSRALVGDRHRGRIRLARPARVGPARLRRPRHPGSRTGGGRLRGCPRVFLAFDRDGAGREAAAALSGLLAAAPPSWTCRTASPTWPTSRVGHTGAGSSCASLNGRARAVR